MILAVAVLEWVVQPFADVARSEGKTWAWLTVCRLYFVLWAYGISILSLVLAPPVLRRLRGSKTVYSKTGPLRRQLNAQRIAL